MRSRGDESFVAAYKEMYEELEPKGFKPTLNVTDNEYSKAVQITLLHKMWAIC